MVECMTEKFGLYPEEKMPEIKLNPATTSN